MPRPGNESAMTSITVKVFVTSNGERFGKGKAHLESIIF